MPHEAPVMPLEYISPPCVEVRPPHQAPARIVVVAGAEREELREGLRDIPRRVLGLTITWRNPNHPSLQSTEEFGSRLAFRTKAKQNNSQTNVKDPGRPASHSKSKPSTLTKKF